MPTDSLLISTIPQRISFFSIEHTSLFSILSLSCSSLFPYPYSLPFLPIYYHTPFSILTSSLSLSDSSFPLNTTPLSFLAYSSTNSLLYFRLYLYISLFSFSSLYHSSLYYITSTTPLIFYSYFSSNLYTLSSSLLFSLLSPLFLIQSSLSYSYLSHSFLYFSLFLYLSFPLSHSL